MLQLHAKQINELDYKSIQFWYADVIKKQVDRGF